jgi:hypothetical protein
MRLSNFYEVWFIFILFCGICNLYSLLQMCISYIWMVGMAVGWVNWWLFAVHLFPYWLNIHWTATFQIYIYIMCWCSCVCHLLAALAGNYVNFGVFELYGDRALSDALDIALKMTLSIPLADILAFRKVCRISWLLVTLHWCFPASCIPLHSLLVYWFVFACFCYPARFSFVCTRACVFAYPFLLRTWGFYYTTF